VTPTMSKWCPLLSPRPLFGPPERADNCGAPFAPALPEGPAKRRGQTPAQQPAGRGATRSRPRPASMASGVERIAAPGGTFTLSVGGSAGGLRAPQTPARYLNKEISRSLTVFFQHKRIGCLRPLPFKTLLPHEPLCGDATTHAGGAPERARSGSRVARPEGPSGAGTLLPQRRVAPPIMLKSRSDFPLKWLRWSWGWV